MNIGILTQESAPKVKMIAKSEDSFQKKTLIMPIVIAAVMVTCSRLPLAAYGQINGGEFDGLDFITKGGSQGDKTALNTCVNYLKEKLFI